MNANANQLVICLAKDKWSVVYNPTGNVFERHPVEDGIYTVIFSEEANGKIYLELKELPGRMYDAKCFAPLQGNSVGSVICKIIEKHFEQYAIEL